MMLIETPLLGLDLQSVFLIIEYNYFSSNIYY